MDELIAKAKAGDAAAAAELFQLQKSRLRIMVRLRLDSRLQQRVDESDVLQDVFIDMTKQIASYEKRDELPFYLWLRMVTAQRLVDVHRKHFNAGIRDVRKEQGKSPERLGATSVNIAAHLAASETSIGSKAIRAERQLKLQRVLDDMEEMDREIIALRNFEMMTNREAALTLGLSKTAASNRYMRALKRLKEELSNIPGFME